MKTKQTKTTNTVQAVKPVKAAKITKKTTRVSKAVRASKKPPVAERKSLAHHAVHHSKRIYHVTPKFVHGILVGAFIGTLIVSIISFVSPASALSIVSTRDCSSNAVLNCGALSTDELKQKYPQAGAASIFNYYGISATDIANMGTTAVAGTAHKDGRVTIGDKTVATGASSVGREKKATSRTITHEGVTFYQTTSQNVFRSNTISVFVVMTNGAFDFAIMGACGNPVTATPTTKPTPPPVAPPITPTTPTTPTTPKPVTPKPANPTPPPTVTPTTPATPTPTPTPTSPQPTPVVITPVSSPQPVSLPETGPGAAITVALLAIIGGYVFHIRRHHTKIKRHHIKKA